jgi:hypothetical protein
MISPLRFRAKDGSWVVTVPDWAAGPFGLALQAL